MTDWTFDGTWPYEPQWFDSVDGRMHYVDEGPRDGRPVVLAHGNPTYRAPHPNWSSRTPILVFPRQIPSGPEGPVSDLSAEIEQGLEQHFRDKPVKIVWAMKDIAFTPEMLDGLWLRMFPEAEMTKLEDAGHYLQEDAHERIVPELVSFLGAQQQQ